METANEKEQKHDFIPVSEPYLSGNELQYVSNAVKAGFISGTGGEYIKQFEEGFAKYCNVKYGISCINGTAALHLAIRAAGIKPGDEVITPTFTNIATTLSIIYVGATPVLIDSRKDTWCMDETQIEEKITPKTKAIIPMHTFGHPVKMDTVMQVANDHNLIVIEDDAEAHGATFNGQVVGSFGQMGCFSFYANKIITTGEGGMVVTSNEEYAKKIRSLKNLAYGEGSQRFMHTDIGYNYRMTNVTAAIGVAQLEKIDEHIRLKRQIAEWYKQGLSNIKGLNLPIEMPWAKNVYWMYGITLDENFAMTKEEFAQALKAKGIDTRPFFAPMEDQPVFQSMGLFKGVKCPVAAELFRTGLYLPSATGIKKETVDYICNSIKEIAK